MSVAMSAVNYNINNKIHDVSTNDVTRNAKKNKVLIERVVVSRGVKNNLKNSYSTMIHSASMTSVYGNVMKNKYNNSNSNSGPVVKRVVKRK